MRDWDSGRARRAVLLFTRPPLVEARVKRLAHLAGLFAYIRDRALGAAASADADLVVVGHPGTSRLPPGTRVIPQRGRGLTRRYLQALHDVRDLGYEEIVSIGSDTPRLHAGHVREAFRALSEGADSVLGRSGDGGVYLLGWRGDVPRDLAGIPWGSRRVFDSLRAVLPGATQLGEQLDDIDDPRRLSRLRSAGLLPAELARLLREWVRPPLPPRRTAPPRCCGIREALLRPVSHRGPPAPSPA